MKTFKLMKQGKGYVAKVDQVIVYEGTIIANKQESTVCFMNAYQEEVYSFVIPKRGFHLFRDRSTKDIIVHGHGKTGTIKAHQHEYTWTLDGCEYTIVCARNDDHVDVILRDQKETLGYVQGGKATLKDLYYSGELCSIWMLLQECKELESMEQERFAHAIEMVVEEWR